MVLLRRGRSAHSITVCVDRTLEAMGITLSRTNIAAKGLHYSLTPSRPQMCQCVASTNSNQPDAVPQIDVSHVFSNPHLKPITSTIVVVDHYRFLILGYFDIDLPLNTNLREIFPHLPWRGEMIVFSLGRRARVLSRPLGPRFVIQKAISVYIRAVIDARISFSPIPPEVTFTSQSIFVV